MSTELTLFCKDEHGVKVLMVHNKGPGLMRKDEAMTHSIHYKVITPADEAYPSSLLRMSLVWWLYTTDSALMYPA